VSAPAPASKSKPSTPPILVKLVVTAAIGLFLLLMVILSVVLLGPLGKGHGLFGTRASLLADFNLIAEIVLLLGLLLGFGFALSKHVSAHQYNQTLWVFFNIILVLFIMLGSYFTQVVSGLPTQLVKLHGLVATLHAILGTITVVCAVYILLRMNGLLPKALRIKWWKNLMRFTLGMYLLVGLFGLATYVVWYVIPLGSSSTTTQTAQATPEAGTVVVPLANYTFNPGTLEIPAGTTVIFRNTDPDPHTVTSESGAWAESQLQQGQEFKFTFNTTGNFPYFCQFHGAKGGVGMAGVIKVVAASAAVTLPAAVVPQKPTPRPTPAAPPGDALGAQAVGYGTFRDVAAPSDGFDLKVGGLPPASGQYDAWLTGGGAALHIGTLQVDAQGNAALEYVEPSGKNLVGAYTGFSITAEAGGSAPTAPSSTVVIANSLPAGVLGPVRQLLVSGDSAPNKIAYSAGLVAMIEELVPHAKAVSGAAALGDSASMDRHIEHMLNILEGKGGPDYGDFDGNGTLQDPGDGYGIDHYIDQIGAQAAAASAAGDASQNVKIHAAELQALAINLRAWANQTADLLLQAHKATAIADKQSLTSQALVLSRIMLKGQDKNGNGVIDPLGGEGGAYTTYFYSQYLAALGAVPEPGSGVATAVPATATAAAVQTSATPAAPPASATPGPSATPGGPAATATSAAPAATATPVPQATATAKPKPIIITYSNFVITPSDNTIQVGQTVTFVIQDGPHEPYNDKGVDQFDSGTNLVNTTYQFKFTQAGTITLLCGYHSNMTAQLTINP
jgi:plastocyanin